MKRTLKLSTFVAVLGLSAFCFASGSVPTESRAASIPSAVPASPYGTYCASCHGGNGKAQTRKGQEMGADDLTSSKVQGMSSSRLTSIITHGKGDMPAFPKLSKAQISSIIRSVKAF